MSEYVIFLPGDESAWAAKPQAEKEATYAKHREFATLLAERGHKVTGGSELTSKEAKLVRGSLDHVTVTDGPFAETVEQITGFYLVETDDLDDLLNVCGLLATVEDALEVRACVGSSQPS